MSRSTHRGTVRDLALLHPMQHSSGIKCCGGQPLGRNIDTGEVERIDPYRWKQHGHINAPIAFALARINGGKTSLAKAMGLRLGQLKNGRQRIRMALDDHRRNSGELEYAKFVKYMGSRELSLARRPINILDHKMKMTRAANLRMLIDVAEYVGNFKLTPYHTISLQVALNMMCDLYPTATTLELLLMFLRAQQVEDVEFYIGRHDRRIFEQLKITRIEQEIYPREDSFWKVDLESRLREKSGIDAQRLRQANLELVFVYERLLGGDFGGTFGGNESLYDHMTQRVVASDYTGLNPQSLGLVQALIWRWKGAAHERADAELAFQLEIHDENHKLWKNIEYARAMSAYMKLIRSTSAFLILNSHRSGDYEAIAGEEGLLAQNALDEAEVLFLGGQPPSVARKIAQRFDLSTKVGERLTTLRTGEFCLVVGSRAPVFIGLELTKKDLVICESNQANIRQLEDSTPAPALER